VHEKTFCGDTWQLSGSMNLTFRGMNANDELVTYRVDRQAVATAHIDLTRRFGAIP
jgi:hypothetical protein